MPSKQIDPAAFAGNRKRNLGCDLPSASAQKRGDRIAERRMARIEQPVELTATPTRNCLDPNIEHAAHSAHAVQTDASDVATLDQRNLRSGYTGPIRDVLLAPSTANAYGAICSSHARVIHVWDLICAA
jgi:hypothetical protein